MPVSAPRRARAGELAMARLEWLMATHAAVLAVALSTLFPPTPRLIWNASASVPIGLYAVRPPGSPSVGELAVVAPPDRLAGFLAERRYLPRGVPLLKRVAALGGHRVCRIGAALSVDGAVKARALDRDRRGRPLPLWQGCRTLSSGEVFLLNPRAPDSLDGRYFGPLPSAAIVGEAVPIWTRAESAP
jgi:conjugative transfer signal peptidase TraF